MLTDRENTQLGSLTGATGNSRAAQALLSRPGGGYRPQLLGQGIQRPGGDSEFEAMMTLNQSQNGIISEVLDGPVSQQTQRQLAQLQALNQKSAPLDDLAASASVSAESPSPVRKGARSLLPGRTINTEGGTGQVFSTAQMAAYRQKNGYQLVLPTRAQPAAREGLTLMDTEKQTAIDSMSESAVETVNAAVSQSRESLHPEGAEKKASSSDEDEIDAIIDRVGLALGVDPSLIRAVVRAESNYNPRAVSHAGAQGLMQLMPKTSKEMGVKDPFDPVENIWGGARYLKRMLDRHGGNVNKALAAYNWGPGNLDRHGYGQNMPRETRRYIEVVNRNYNRYKNETKTA